MNQAASCLATRSGFEGLHKIGGFYEKKSGARELLTKEKKKLFGGQNIFSLGEENTRVFIVKVASSFCGGWRGPTDYLPNG